MKLTKMHYIVCVMAFHGLDGASRPVILRTVHTLKGSKILFKPRSNHCYFTAGSGNGDELSLIHKGLIFRPKRGMYYLTDKGREMADRVYLQFTHDKAK
jgi:hypothetical protein